MRIKKYIRKLSVTGKRIPLELDLEVKRLQRQANAVGKKLSYQDALRRFLRDWKRRD
jgi:hypothetical protein